MTVRKENNISRFMDTINSLAHKTDLKKTSNVYLVDQRRHN